VLDDQRIEQLIAATLNEQPRAATHWSTRAMAKQLKVTLPRFDVHQLMQP